MKRILMFGLCCLLLVTTGCNTQEKKDEVIPPPVQESIDVVGQWKLTGAELTVKSVLIGSENVDVYVDFKEDGAYELFQKMGAGRYTRFAGKWNLAGNVLSGKYLDGEQWANVYTVGVEGETLKMNATVGSSDVYTYTRCQIPGNLEVYPKK